MPEVSFSRGSSPSSLANTSFSTSPTTAEASDNPSRVQMRQRFAGSPPPKVQNSMRWLLTSDLWLQQNKGLLLHAGPSEASWTMPMRVADEDIRTGKVRYAQLREAANTSTYYDLPTVSLTFQGGNALPVFDRKLNVSINGRSIDARTQAGAPRAESVVDIAPGLEDFYLFLDLLNQPPRIAAGSAISGRNNYTWIFYTSTKFPAVTLKGYFSAAGPSFTDAAEDPNGLTWTAEFIVHESAPEITSAASMLANYRARMVGAGT